MIVGTANWNDLRGFYPRGTKASEKLAAYAARLSGVEVNATFFRMLKPETVAAWADQTPSGFMLSLKSHRFVSAWLRSPDKADATGFERHLAMAQPLLETGKFAGYLMQFPGKLSAEMDIERSLSVLREGFGDLPLAVELPNAPDVQLDGRIAEALRMHNIARVRHDSLASERAPMPIDSDDLVYFRFRGPAAASNLGDDGRMRYSAAQIRERAGIVEQAASCGSRLTMVVCYGKKDVDTADAALRLTAELEQSPGNCRWLIIRRDLQTRRPYPLATTDRGRATRMSSGPCSTCRTWRCARSTHAPGSRRACRPWAWTGRTSTTPRTSTTSAWSRTTVWS